MLPDLSGSRIRSFRPLALGLGALLLGACAGATARPAAAPAPRLSTSDVAPLAELLRLEDTRDFDAARLSALSTSAVPEIRRRAMLAIGRLKDPRGTVLLLPRLTDPDTAVAATAAFALGLLGDTSAVAPLVARLASAEAVRAPSVAAEAAAALGKLRGESAHAAVREFLRTAPLSAADALPARYALLAIWKFPRASDSAAITRWLSAADPELRWRAAYALVRRPDPAAARPLLAAARDTDARVRALALRGLARPLADSAALSRDSVLAVLTAATRDTDYAVRVNAVRTLAGYGAQGAVVLEPLLRDRQPQVALAAAESFQRIGTAGAAAAPTLISLVTSATEPIALRATALQALAAVASADAERLALAFARDPEWRARAAAAQALTTLGPLDRPELIRLARDADGRVAAMALGAMLDAAGDALPTLQPLLVESLGAPDVIVRATALGGIARLKDPASLPRLLDAYQRAQADTLDDAALAAVDALQGLGGSGSAPARAFLQRFPRSSDPLVRLKVVQAFGDLAREAWGDPLPIEHPLPEVDYAAEAARVRTVINSGRLPRARIITEAGTIELELFSGDAPLTVLNFERLARSGYFNGQRWPRVVPNFVIQGGDARGDMSGGPGYAIRDEMNRHLYETGTLGMALSGPDTGGSQWFITHSPQPHLDGTYTVFGQVRAGQDVVERVLPNQRIERVEVIE
jgi:cyclophilin family peptidyl-prolyl cis-trans isomerase/HEAT repeat protein